MQWNNIKESSCVWGSQENMASNHVLQKKTYYQESVFESFLMAVVVAGAMSLVRNVKKKTQQIKQEYWSIYCVFSK